MKSQGFYAGASKPPISLPIPQVIINPVDPATGSQVNKFLQYTKNTPVSGVNVTNANDMVMLGIQLKVTEGQNLEWLKNSPMVFVHTLRDVYADYRVESSNSGNRITHIPNTPGGVVDGASSWGQRVQLEPLNRTGTNFGGGHMRWNGTYSGGTVPRIQSEFKFNVTKDGGIEIIGLNGFELGYKGLSTATFPIRIWDVDSRYEPRNKKRKSSNRIGFDPRVKIPLWFTFACIDPSDGKSVIESEYSQCVYLEVKTQELEWDGTPENRGDTYLIDWITRISR